MINKRHEPILDTAHPIINFSTRQIVGVYLLINMHAQEDILISTIAAGEIVTPLLHVACSIRLISQNWSQPFLDLFHRNIFAFSVALDLSNVID
jgi:hypothetical protein